MSERLEIDGLRALLEVSRRGGVTRAADHLGISQSAVSHKLRRMEQSLDCDLLTRRGGGAPRFTDAGRRLIDYARRMVALHDEALADLGKKPLTGAIRLGLTEDIAISDISQAMGRFTRLYPGVRVTMRTGQSLKVREWLKAGEIDLAIIQVFAHEVAADDVTLFDDSLHWVKARDLALDLAAPVPFLSFDSDCFYRQWGLEAGRVPGVRFERVLECPSAAGICAAVRAGLGVALLNGMHVTGEMEIVDDLFPPPPQITYVLRPAQRQKSAPVSALLREIARDGHRTGAGGAVMAGMRG